MKTLFFLPSVKDVSFIVGNVSVGTEFLSLLSLSDLSLWESKNFCNISFLFHGCKKLTSFPNINIWNLDNIDNKNNIY